MYSRIHFAFLLLVAWWARSDGSLEGYSGRQDAGGGAADGGQFHLQTDGDGDRYFIYQTNNGQYRKERRLKDGSVVGTTGWVDAAGYLRLQDYIADDQGYRIYKSKTVFVGPDTSIADSLQIAKSAPTDPGYSFTPAPAPHRVSTTSPHTSTRPALVSSPHTFPLEVAWWARSDGSLEGYSGRQDAGGGAADGGQFHLQTDGDGDRYFIYQTNNGQYRKERRLKDGSVVGTTGWVDAAGYLRLQDYIADDQGYRIYKSKTVFVGPDTSIADSLQIAKSAPTDPGYSFTPAPAPHRVSTTSPHTSTRPALVSSPHTFPLEVSVTPPPPYRSTTYTSVSAYTPSVDVSPNSVDSSSDEPRFDFRPTVAPITADDAASAYAPPTPYYRPPSSDAGDTNDLEYESRASTPYRRLDYFNPNSYRHSGEWRRRLGTSKYRFTPPDSLRLGDGYTPQFPNYDGVGVTTRGGFRYYLPKQYHEEEVQQPDGAKTGSFGYVDPFGIRRVIYYNADPASGFEVRKNNRYVGHDAAPYDPRPV